MFYHPYPRKTPLSGGGGPYSEMFRRTAHWLMGEPDLDAEKLTATAENELLAIERRTLEDRNQKVTVKKPDGTSERVTLSKTCLLYTSPSPRDRG